MSYAKPLPAIDVWSRPFWEGARRKVLTMPCCGECGHVFFPPGPVCPACRSSRLEWKECSGKATVESWVVFHQLYYKGFAGEIPYNVATVRLEEGPQLVTNIVGVANDAIRAGMPVEVTFEVATDDVTIPKFRPANEGK
jgi:uncharacterized OB-fold protein